MIFIGGMILGVVVYVAPRFLDGTEQHQIAGAIYRLLGMSAFFISMLYLLPGD